MASYKFVLFSGNLRQDSRYPLSIRVTKDRKSKYIRTGIIAFQNQWDENTQRFINNKRIVPHYKVWNSKLSEIEVQINEIFREFEINRVDWTLNQFEDSFLNRASKSKVEDFFEELIFTLRDTGHHGNANCYQSTFHILKLFDRKFEEKIFSEIDFKYVKAFDVFLQKRGCKGNTRKFYLKALRAVLNKAIKENEASEETYPFAKGGFNISALEEDTAKRYLPQNDMEKIKNTILENQTLEMTRKLFLFSYYCYGISFIDAALLTNKNLIRFNEGVYIVYKRNKTNRVKNVKPIQIKITNEIQQQLDWFLNNTLLIKDYLLPIVSIDIYNGEKLYNHIRGRSKRNNKNLSRLAEALEIELKLTSYVSRHTMAMTLQNNNIPREVISQILGHSDITTTNIYLDSFDSSVIDKAAKVL